MDDTSKPLSPASAMKNILDWSETTPLPEWQCDALRRLTHSFPISKEDEDDLFLILRTRHSLLEEGEEPINSEPLTKSDIPRESDTAASVTLQGIYNPTHVNALSSDHSLRFCENGLTVIFGNNGSGKSGYTRVLKSVCRARSSEEILPNVYDQDPGKPASATIRFKLGGVAQTPFEWQSGAMPDAMLSTVSVFDSKCATIHVDEKNEAAYIPQPLRILKDLSDICRRFKSNLQSKVELLGAEIPSSLRILECERDSKAGKFLHNLSADSSFAEATELANISDQDIARIDELRLTLKSDPNLLATKEEARTRRLASVLERVKSTSELLSDDAATALKELLIKEHSTNEAATLAASQAFGDEPLSGIGSETWQVLWNAARAYSEASVYPDLNFPVTDDALCILCGQTLGEEAKQRLIGFETFVQTEAQSAAENARLEVEFVERQLLAGIPSTEQMKEDVSLMQDEIVEPKLAKQLCRFYRESIVRGGRMVQATRNKTLPRLRKFKCVPIDQISDQCSLRLSRIEDMRSSANVETRSKLVRELCELEDRVFLRSVLDDVKLEIIRKQKLNRLNQAIAETDTSKITRKSTELADSLVTAAWRDKFAEEISRLEISHLRIELQREGGAYGSAKFRVALIRGGSVKLGRVLSEGEYRCIALAAFFSELSTADHCSTLVFDDPVSSLDHEHREAVAKRLAEEAEMGRQVVVFTHDVYFLDLLSRHTKRLGVTTKYVSVNRFPYGSTCGAIDDGIPATVAPALDLANGISRQVKQYEGLYKSGRLVKWNAQTNSISIQLRKCWERAVAEALAPVVERFNGSVNTKNVWMIAALETADCVTMRQAYKRCSELNHEKCAELNRKDPSPSDFFEEVTVLKSWIERVRQKQEEALNNRPTV